MDDDCVSVITPAFNAASCIERTIRSVQEQSHRNWEMIVVDDCSRDATRDIVKKCAARDGRIRLVALDKNNGAPAVPRNLGVREAKGQWVAFLDADDVWHPQKLATQLQVMRKGEIPFSSTQMVNFFDENEIQFEWSPQFAIENITFRKQQLKGRIPASSVVAEKKLIEKFRFNEDFRYKAVEDYHCWLKIHEHIGESVKLLYPFLFYRRIDGQISQSKKYMLQRIYMVHREYPGNTMLRAIICTVGHALGGAYYRFLKKGI